MGSLESDDNSIAYNNIKLKNGWVPLQLRISVLQVYFSKCTKVKYILIIHHAIM